MKAIAIVALFFSAPVALAGGGILDAIGAKAYNTAGAYVYACGKFSSDSQKLNECRGKLEQLKEKLEANGFVVLNAKDCEIKQAGSSEDCGESFAKAAYGSVSFVRR